MEAGRALNPATAVVPQHPLRPADVRPEQGFRTHRTPVENAQDHDDSVHNFTIDNALLLS